MTTPPSTVTESRTPSGYAKRLPRDERRKQILDAALPEFMERGFLGAHIDSIAEKVGVSKPVIYSVFPDKDALATAVVEEAHRVEAELHVADPAHIEGYEALARGEITPLFDSAFRIAHENPTLLKFLYSDFRSAPSATIAYHDSVFEARAQGIRHYLLIYFAGKPDFESLTERVSEAVGNVGRLGILRSTSHEEDPRELARIYGSMLEGGIKSL